MISLQKIKDIMKTRINKTRLTKCLLTNDEGFSFIYFDNILPDIKVIYPNLDRDQILSELLKLAKINKDIKFTDGFDIAGKIISNRFICIKLD